MVYDWDAHKETCYRLYVEEGKSMDELMEYMREVHQFNASKRAFQTQIRRWEFPIKQVAASKNESLVDRVRELWEANTRQRDMLRVLQQEGFDVSGRQLLRLRTQKRWLLRAPKDRPQSATKQGPYTTAELTLEPLLGLAEDVDEDDDRSEASDDGGAEAWTSMQLPGGGGGGDPRLGVAAVSGVDPASATAYPLTFPDDNARETAAATALRNQRRRLQMETESAERWEARKRRRHTRDYAGMPADPPGPPRFPSELTLTEAKVLLRLDQEAYRDMRTRFHHICEEDGLERKTVAGQKTWDEAKARLVRETPHLRTFVATHADSAAPTPAHSSRGEGEEGTAEESGAGYSGVADTTPHGSQNGAAGSISLAIDIICTDVIKRKRSQDRGRQRPTMAEAKNILVINPNESRSLRLALYRILRDNQVTSKLEVGTEGWDDVKKRWIGGSPELQRALARVAPGQQQQQQGDDKRTTKVEVLRAIEALARDGLKRFRDDVRRGKGPDGGVDRLSEVPEAFSPSDVGPSPLSMPLDSTVNNDDDGGSDGAGVFTHARMEVMVDDALEAMSYAHVDDVTHATQLALVPGTPADQQLQLAVAGPVMDAAAGMALDPQIDPSLLLAADAQTAASFVDQGYMGNLQQAAQQTASFHHHHHEPQQQQQHNNGLSTHSGDDGVGLGHVGNLPPIAMYLQPQHRSNILLQGPTQHHHHQQQPQSPNPSPAFWVVELPSPPASSIDELRAIAAERMPAGSICLRIEGVVKDIHHHHHHGHHQSGDPKMVGGGGGGELVWPVQTDDDLASFLQHVQAVGVAPTYNVHLMHYGVT